MLNLFQSDYDWSFQTVENFSLVMEILAIIDNLFLKHLIEIPCLVLLSQPKFYDMQTPSI